MAMYFGLDPDYSSSFFSSNLNTKKTGMSGLYNSLSDYGSIRNGGYTRLLKQYYKKKGSDSSSETNTDKTNPLLSTTDKAVASDASSLKGAASTLSSMEYSEENRSKITAGIKNFVSSYNSTLASSKNSTSDSVVKKSQMLGNMTEANKVVLSKIGITVKSDHSLSVDENQLASADLSYAKALFKGNYSYGSSVQTKASELYNASGQSVFNQYI